MKKGLGLFLGLLVGFFAYAEDTITPLKFYNATDFRIINKGWENTAATYHRMPAYMEDSCREQQWWLYTHSSGIGVRFATNSKRIAAHYNLIHNFHMQHMPMTGIKGTDLYFYNAQRNKWEHVNTHRPQETNGIADSIQSKIYVENLDGEMHEYLIYLPLYDGINWLQIGVDSGSIIEKPQIDNPRKPKIVFYGTSIMQGGCACRPGMVATAMIQRDFNLECVNLGTSGQGKMDYYIARCMATIEDAICYVLDPIPNCTKDMCDTLTYNFVNILRTLRPEVPIIMVEGMIYPYARHDSYFAEYLPQKNEAFRKNYEKLIQENPKNLYYVPCDGLTGVEMEGTVDGVHYTDLGFRAYADILEPYIKEALDNTGVNYHLEPQTYFAPYTKAQKQQQKRYAIAQLLAVACIGAILSALITWIICRRTVKNNNN